MTGRVGRAISFVSQYDIELVQRIESLIEKKLELWEVEEEEVLEHFKETLAAKRKARMTLVDQEARGPKAGHKKRKANWISTAETSAS